MVVKMENNNYYSNNNLGLVDDGGTYNNTSEYWNMNHQSNQHNYVAAATSSTTDGLASIPYHPNGGRYAYQHGRLVSLDGIQSGVPTLTTSTLTPTTLRNIEQTFIELTSDPPISAPYQAGFVPPLAPLNFIDNNDNNSLDSESDSGESESSWHSPMLHEENSMATTDTSSVATTINPSGSPSLPTATTTASTTKSGSKSTPTRRNVGGRRPNRSANLSPEEEAKRQLRRERNKQAAARCRKRRVDQTNELIDKVDCLEKEKEGLQKKIDELQVLKEDLQLCLHSHRAHCRLQPSATEVQRRSASPLDIKPKIDTVLTNCSYPVKIIKDEPIDFVESFDGPTSPKRIMLSANNSKMFLPPLPNVSTISSTIASTTAMLNTPTITTTSTLPPPFSAKPNRPSSLNVPLTITPSQALGFGKNVSDISGVPITTPSSGVMFNFDSLMDGGTGLTPVSAPLMPCSSQNTKHPMELTTPTSEPSKLVSL